MKVMVKEKQERDSVGLTASTTAGENQERNHLHLPSGILVGITGGQVKKSEMGVGVPFLRGRENSIQGKFTCSTRSFLKKCF